MERFIAYEKLSKKEKRKVDSRKRKTWGSLNPVTRKPPNSKVYNRKKNQCRKDELNGTDFCNTIVWHQKSLMSLDCHSPNTRKITPPNMDD